MVFLFIINNFETRYIPIKWNVQNTVYKYKINLDQKSVKFKNYIKTTFITYIMLNHVNGVSET
jgi:hypothetical protein